MNTTKAENSAEPEQAPTTSSRVEPFIAAFLRGTGRTRDIYDDSWPAANSPAPQPPADFLEGPERALG